MGAAFLFLSCSSSGGTGGTGGTGGNVGGGGNVGSGGNPDGSSASCMQVSPCGGDVVGTWRISQSCVIATGDLTTCAGATVELDLVIGGTVTYNADRTYSSMPTGGAGTYHEHFPPGCMPYGMTCDQLEQTLGDGGATTTATCSTDSTGACNCVGQEPEMATNQAGTYVTSGSTLTTTTQDGTSSSSNYCVRGNTLYTIVEPGDGALQAMGNLVLVKQ
jgi:hypothetical protein